MTRIISKAFSNVNKGTALGNGDWKVEVIMTETFGYDDGTEKSEVIEAMCIDSNFQEAHTIALASALEQYRDEVFDKGLTSLIESREKFGKLDDKSRDNKDTLTQ